ncbi:hypothetical protein LTR62_006511 [Meristemomyces frigidus]|uniref:Uncharacterized protein n=1 Tax=Meristemomyces frigidus TaxID=1508187 RepID=A0AAN7TJR0_9PEZI|nr:hypothetical protein LTR62_006511 [Meristemomyces frigidus]
MYVEARPLSVYGTTQGWKPPVSSSPSRPLNRPPLRQPASSSSSLAGMEQTIPSFRSFVQRTPPPDPLKPLPPTPLRPRRPSSFSNVSSRASSPSSRYSRRSSSVYSRTQSQWGMQVELPSPAPTMPRMPSWHTADLADQNLLLRPIAYSVSTSQLLTKASSSEQTLEARTYAAPLINKPSPTVSRNTTPSPGPVEPRPSMLLPLPAGIIQVPKKHLRTVSLEKAKQLSQAPGAVHLLPEELRAQTLGRSRSQEPMREVWAAGIAHNQADAPEIPAMPTLIDNQGRERVLSLPRISLPPLLTPMGSMATMWRPTVASPTMLHVGTAPMKTMAPLSSQRNEASRAKAAQALGLGDADGPRGRTKTRGPRHLSYEHYLPQQAGRRPEERNIDSDSDSAEDRDAADARKIAHEYHAMLSQQYRETSGSRATQASSELDLGTRMKLVPQPLFSSRSAGRRSSARGSEASASPFHGRAPSNFDDGSRRSSTGSHGSIPLRLSFSSGRPWQGRRGTNLSSGMIPISPPTATAPMTTSMSLRDYGFADSPPVPMEVKAPRKLKPRPIRRRRRSGEDQRISAYYPHVIPRRKKGEKKVKGGGRSVSAGSSSRPMLATDIVAGRSREGSLGDSPFSRSRLAVHTTDTDSVRSNDSHSPFHRRIFNKATKYVNKFGRSLDPDEKAPRRSEERQRPVASPLSPDLFPSPTSSDGSKFPPPIHLGWTETAKTAFDESRSPTSPIFPRCALPTTYSSTTPSPTTPTPTNNILTTYFNPRTSADSHKSLSPTDPPESPSGRKNSYFATGFGLMDSWRESKAEKRRETLKRIIRVVMPAEEEGRGEGVRVVTPAQATGEAEEGRGDALVRVGSGGVRPGLGRERRSSAFGWM